MLGTLRDVLKQICAEKIFRISVKKYPRNLKDNLLNTIVGSLLQANGRFSLKNFFAGSSY